MNMRFVWSLVMIFGTVQLYTAGPVRQTMPSSFAAVQRQVRECCQGRQDEMNTCLQHNRQACSLRTASRIMRASGVAACFCGVLACTAYASPYCNACCAVCCNPCSVCC